MDQGRLCCASTAYKQQFSALRHARMLSWTLSKVSLKEKSTFFKQAQLDNILKNVHLVDFQGNNVTSFKTRRKTPALSGNKYE